MYTVWTKANYTDAWERIDCGDLEAVKREVLKATQEGREVEVTQPMDFIIEVKVKEVPLGATLKSKAQKTSAENEGKGDPSGEAD